MFLSEVELFAKPLNFFSIALFLSTIFSVTFASYAQTEDLFSKERQAVPYPRAWTVTVAPLFGSDFKAQSSSIRGAELSIGRFFRIADNLEVRPFVVMSRYAIKSSDEYEGGVFFDEYSVRGWGMGGELHLFAPLLAAPTSLFVSMKFQNEIANLTRLQNSDAVFAEQNFRDLAGNSSEYGLGFSLQPSKSYAFFGLLARRSILISQTDTNPNVRLQLKDKSEGFSLDGAEHPDLWQGPNDDESISTLGFSVGIVFAL